jgi:hypothetical protein
MTARFIFALLVAAGTSGCGAASVSPIVTDADVIDEPQLEGSWTGLKDSAVFTATGIGKFDIVHTDEHGRLGHYAARYGRLGPYRVLDLQPADPSPASNDEFKSLIVRAHGVIFIDSIGDSIKFRIIEPDTLKSYVATRRREIPHILTEGTLLLTGSSAESRRFLTSFARRRGALSEQNVWARRNR